MAALFDSRARLQGMLDFEAALAAAQADVGLIPSKAAKEIARQCQGGLYDPDEIFAAAAHAGTPAIPLVKALTARVGDTARGYVHWGATSQDAVDTGLMLQMRRSITLLVEQLIGLGALASKLADRHQSTPMVARTLLQQALPMPFGLKAAHWLSAVTRAIIRLRRDSRDSLCVQLGGAAGTAAALGQDGAQIAALMADRLGLATPSLPWHTERDRIGVVTSAVGLAAAAAGKIGHDIAALMQTEVGELLESAGPNKGGSSTLPHKRNPVSSVLAQTATRLAVGHAQAYFGTLIHEHERAVGAWHAEWSIVTDLFCTTSAAVSYAADSLTNIDVDESRMHENLARSSGLIMAESVMMHLANRMGRANAKALVSELCQSVATSGKPLRAQLAADKRVTDQVSEQELDALMAPETYFGSAGIYIENARRDFDRAVADETKP